MTTIEAIKEMSYDDLSSSELYDDILLAKSFDPFLGQRVEEAMLNRARELTQYNSVKRLYDVYKRTVAAKAVSVGGNTTAFTDQPITLRCGDWTADDSGIRKQLQNRNGDYETKLASRTPLLITEIYKNVELALNNEKVRVAYCDVGVWKTMIAPASTIADGVQLQRMLSGNGIDVTSNSAKLLVDYFQCIKTGNRDIIPTIDSIDRLGWLDGNFTPYNGLKFDGEAESREIFEAIDAKGDFEKWRECVFQLSRKSLYVRMQLAASFASPLIELLHLNPFILHLHGGTGSGKTVGIMIAMSIWGNPKKGRMWRSMDNTLTYVTQTAATLYNLPVGLDELQLLKGRMNYNTLIMKLCEGIDRGRCEGTRKRDTLTWHNAFLTTGEDPIIQEGSGGGSVNRVIELDCNNKIVVENGNEVVNFLLENYGHAGEKYIEGIMVKKGLHELYNQFFKELLEKSDTTEKQASAMAVMLLADLMANLYVFHESDTLTADDVLEFLADNKSVALDERAYRYVLDLAAANKDRFNPEIVGEHWGQIADEDIIEWNKTVLLRKMQEAGYDFNACKKVWAAKGYLVKSAQGRYIHQTMRDHVRCELVKLRQVTEPQKTEENSAPPF